MVADGLTSRIPTPDVCSASTLWQAKRENHEYAGAALAACDTITMSFLGGRHTAQCRTTLSIRHFLRR